MSITSVAMKQIEPIKDINIVDKAGYIGETITDYYLYTGNNYYQNYAIVIESADFSNLGKGRVTFIGSGGGDEPVVEPSSLLKLKVGNQKFLVGWPEENE
jgi:hypothetical protein